jgi:hypothetical protein
MLQGVANQFLGLLFRHELSIPFKDHLRAVAGRQRLQAAARITARTKGFEPFAQRLLDRTLKLACSYILASKPPRKSFKVKRLRLAHLCRADLTQHENDILPCPIEASSMHISDCYWRTTAKLFAIGATTFPKQK